MVGLDGWAGWARRLGKQADGLACCSAMRPLGIQWAFSGHFDVPCALAPAADKGAATGAAVFVFAAAVAISFVRCAVLCGVAVLRWPEIGCQLASALAMVLVLVLVTAVHLGLVEDTLAGSSRAVCFQADASGTSTSSPPSAQPTFSPAHLQPSPPSAQPTFSPARVPTPYSPVCSSAPLLIVCPLN
ncbi:unnamed protein product [[Candida] boidinii]|nr:unnamed protein product [[Candida] boidinii]